MGANFSPEFLNYNNRGNFVFWAQKVIPLVYDNSLSYYETLCKVVDYLNNVIENVDTAEANLDSLHAAYDLLQDYVNHYFDNLDVQEEINNKLDELVDEGYFADFFTNFVTPEQYGAVGDGVTDDTVAISAAINSHKTVMFGQGKTYIVTALPAYWGMRLVGNGCTLKRPNLSEPPYGWSDYDIKWNRFFDMRTSVIGDVADEVTQFEGITFDGNCFAMWSESDGYKYEQASFIAFAATRAGNRAQVIIRDCKFVNNFSSGVSISVNMDVQMSNCYARNCFKGIATIVGENSIINMNDIIDKNDYDSFATINVEINHENPSTELPTFINLTNAYLEKNFKTGYSYNGSMMNYTNVDFADMKSIIVNNGGVTNFVNCNFALTYYNPESHDFHYSIYGTGTVRFKNCKIRGVNTTDTFAITTNASQLALRFVDCAFLSLPNGLWTNSVHISNSLYFERVSFDQISGDVLSGLDRNNFTFREIIFTDCYISCEGYVYKMIGSSTQTSGTPVYFKGLNYFPSTTNCQGLYVYGRDSSAYSRPDMFVFENQQYLNPKGLQIKVDRSGNHPPLLRGRRERYVTENPNNIEDPAPAYYPIDYAILKYSPYTVWRYNGSTWVEVTE